ncbi:aldo/keto reductase [Nonomuraea sp. FMUSA5-5]|uniref:Aldo/keto reductase n=1 Tax=Nonomuraea composti TaxID=2720023 RepID=A0ABX1ARR2_9ACTN|nr:aldo/keto reductase [Nonomuraea sp. FMUSA5-5]NJP88335.1 aldo/keto reductase [Nonomuraea sp. FMUSA5-5]
MTVMLADGRPMPRLGLGTWPMNDEEARQAVTHAISLGYRLIDTAASYGNEAGAAVAQASVAREELFVTTKLRGSHHGYDAALRGFEESRARLGLDYVDLYLIHWPLPGRGLYIDTWRAFVHLREQGLVHSIGVSNFTPEQIDRITGETGVAPVVNQVEMHPGFPQDELRAWHAEHDIVTESWSPLGRGSKLLDEPAVTDLAAAHGRTPAQVVLRWHVQMGAVPIPKSADPERMRQNLEVFDFSLSSEDLARLEPLATGGRLGGDPDTHVEL